MGKFLLGIPGSERFRSAHSFLGFSLSRSWRNSPSQAHSIGAFQCMPCLLYTKYPEDLIPKIPHAFPFYVQLNEAPSMHLITRATVQPLYVDSSSRANSMKVTSPVRLIHSLSNSRRRVRDHDDNLCLTWKYLCIPVFYQFYFTLFSG